MSDIINLKTIGDNMSSIIYDNKEYNSLLELTIDVNVSYPLIKSMIREGVSLEEAILIGKGNNALKEASLAKEFSRKEKVLKQYQRSRKSAINRENKILESLIYNDKNYNSLKELSKEIKKSKNVSVPRSTLLSFLPKGYSVDEIIEKVKIAKGIK